jgi:hypothetical protein
MVSDKPESQGADTVVIGPHIVLFLDVLDQRDAIRRLEQQYLGQRENIIPAIKGSAGKVLDIIKWLKRDFLDNLQKPRTNPLPESATRHQQELYDHFKAGGEGEMKTQRFSDTIVAFKLLDHSRSIPDVRPVHALLLHRPLFI